MDKTMVNRKLYNAMAFLSMYVMAVSCLVDGGGKSARNEYNIIQYSDNIVGASCIFQPVAAVAVARDADVYLSLPEEERKEFDVASLFPEGGLLHIDDNSVRISGLAAVYSYGTRFDEPGSVWKVKMESPYWPYLDAPYYYSGSYGDFSLRCIGEDCWEIDAGNSDFGYGLNVSDASVIVKYAGKEGEKAVYNVVSSGTVAEDGGYQAEFRTGDDGVTMHHDKDAVSGSNLMYDTYSFRQYGGGFEVVLFQDNEMLDFCTVTYSQGNAYYSTSFDD